MFASSALSNELKQIEKRRPLLYVQVIFIDFLVLSVAELSILFTLSLVQEGDLLLLLCIIPIWVLLHMIWTISSRTRGFLRAGPRVQPKKYILYLRGSDADFDPTDIGFEDALVKTMAPIGPIVTIDSKNWNRRSSAIRIAPFAPDVNWTDEVGWLADDAALIVFRLSPRRGYRVKRETVVDSLYGRAALDGAWLEIEMMPEEAFKGRSLFCIGHHWDNRRLQRTNANGTIDLGLTTLLGEISEFVPNKYVENWPKDLGGSRWLWIDSAGKAVVPGNPAWSHSVWNSAYRMSRELSGVLSYFRHSDVPPLRSAAEWIGIVITTVAINLYLYPLISSFSHLKLLLTGFGTSTLIAVIWFRRHLIKSAYIVWKYGSYENFVWPMYKYTNGSDRPNRRNSSENVGAG